MAPTAAPLTSQELFADLNAVADKPHSRGIGAGVGAVLKVVAPEALKILLDFLASKYDIRPKA